MRFYEGPSKDGLYSPPQSRIPVLLHGLPYSRSFSLPLSFPPPKDAFRRAHGLSRTHAHTCISRNTGIIASEV